MLLLVSIITFSHLLPRSADRRGYAGELATRYVGRTANRPDRHATAERLGFNDPFYVQYGHWVKTVVVGADSTTWAPRRSSMPGPLLRLLVHHPATGLARPARPDARARPT